MDKIRSYEQYREQLARARASGYRSSNCFFLPEAVREKIAAGSLFFLSVENGLLLLDHCRLRWFASQLPRFSAGGSAACHSSLVTAVPLPLSPQGT